MIQRIQYKLVQSIPVLIIGMLFSCQNTKRDIEKITFSESYPDESTRNAVIYYSDSARIQIILKAPLIERYHGEDPYDLLPEGVDVTFFDSEGEVDSRITANHAKHLVKRQLMEARHDVHVVNRDGDILNTEHLVWDQVEHRIYSDEFVKITTAEEIIYGDGLEANEDFTQYTIHHIKGIIEVNEEDPSSSESDSTTTDEKIQ